MAVSYVSQVNQKLAHASYSIRLLEVNQPFEHFGDASRQGALIDACLFHLQLAFKFYLRELAELNGVKSHYSICSISELGDALRSLGRQSSDVRELSDLAIGAGTWLRRLQSSYELLSFSSSPLKQAKAFPVASGSVIPLVDVSEVPEYLGEAKVSVDGLAFIYDAFLQLIVRQRETNAEC